MPGIVIDVKKSKEKTPSLGAAILEWAAMNVDREPTPYDKAMRKIKGLDPVTEEDRERSRKALQEERERKMREQNQ